tara:strand:+ start:714 stop:1295 length:582 start_codon:yes stop_codon:yes gene_type:complete
MKNLESAYLKLNNFESGVSCHYLISRSGLIFNLLCPNFKAWHAGKSQWKNIKNLNNYSIGIELENKGHQFGYNFFTNRQYQSLKNLIKFLKKNFYLEDQNIIFHSDISPNRKKDPGEKFYLEKININRFKRINLKKKKYSIRDLLKIYGFSNNYIENYREPCIIAVKRSMNYKKIDNKVSKKFISDFYNLIFL